MGAQAVRLSNVDIDNALKNKDFEVLFQPIFDLSTGAFARVEAFVRWRHRALGVLPPGAFISYFETQGRMSELTRYVLDRALSDYLDWRGPTGPGFSINLALSDLADDSFANHLSVHLRDRGIAPELITLECPMPPVTMATESAAAHFERLSETGVRLAIEVRGRANDFLKTIDPFPFDEIKTGGAAILRFARTVRGPGLSAIEELLQIAKSARSAIVAVGVEDQASLAALRSLGFTAAQGNHLAQVGALSKLQLDKVNEVRPLLGLAALSDAEIAGMTQPAQKTDAAQRARRGTTKSHDPVDRPDSSGPTAAKETIDRLNARIARQHDHEEPDERSRIKAALGAKQGAALTKAAAIAKAKRKVGAPLPESGDLADGDTNRDIETSVAPSQDLAAGGPPTRRLLDRISKAFDRNSSESSSPAPSLAGEADRPSSGADTTQNEGRRAVKEEPASPERPQEPDPRSFRLATLPIGGARAYFRPAVHVAAAPYAEPLAPSVSDDIVEFRIDDAPPASLLDRGAGPPPELRDAEPLAATIAPPAPPLPTEPPAAQAPETPRPTAARRRRARKKPKSFLQRHFYISHFWPRSWKRWWDAQASRSQA